MAELVLGVAKSLVQGTLTMAQAAIEEELKLRQSTQRDLVFIASEFQMMQSFLSITTEEHVRNSVVSTWVMQVRDLAYDVEDCIEFIVHLDTKADWWRRLIQHCYCIAPALPLDKAVSDIEQLKARVHDVSQRNVRYNLIGNSGPKPVIEIKPPAAGTPSSRMLAETWDTAWTRQELKDMTKLITRNGNGLQVISVWETGDGRATTSIARKVFNEPEIWKNFTCRAWVKLMHPLNLQELIRSLLNQFYANSHKEQQDVIIGIDLLQEFMKQVNKQRYLVVLEDVSTMVEWDVIRKYLPDMSNGSRIIVSTQQFEIASFCTGLPYFQQFSADLSLCIFFKEDPQIDGGKNKATNGGIVTDHSPLIGRISEINELPKYPAMARVSALQVMSVWGIAGAGKSALVRNLYHKKVLQNNEFEKHGWVDISYPFNLREFCHSLLLQFHSHSLEANDAIYCGTTGIRDPVTECHNLLKSHRCLVVIDNLKSAEEWDLIQASVVSRPSKSIIIVVTNEASVALHCTDRKDLVFNVKGLEAGAAIDLFKKEVRKNAYFPVDDIDNDEELRQLISKCGGLPKLIVSVADSLAQVFNWTEKTRILNGQFISNLEMRQEFAYLQGLFGWIHSYFRACPDFLKPCIFYLSIFPKSQIIRRRRLVMRWVAEGYSKDKDNYPAEENGEELFTKITELSMIQPPEHTIITNMRMVWCQVSAFFHEYIISRPKEENVTFALEVFTLEGCCRQTTGRTGRHLVIEKSWERDRIVFESIDLSRLRSFTVFGKWESFFISPSMKVLRVLDLENASGVTDEDLKKMLNLLPRLKYLSLRGCSEICHLPSMLGDLRQLQILDIRDSSIVTLPASFTKLKKLQYIRGGTTAPSEPTSCHQQVAIELHASIDTLTALHTFGVVNVDIARGKTILVELKKLTQLRKLGVFGINKKNSNEFCSAISGHAHLESLSVWIKKNNQNCLDDISSNTPPPKNLHSLKLYGLVNKLPLWISMLDNIKKLVLEIIMETEADITVLGGLQKLCVLCLCVKPIQDGKLNFLVKTNEGVEVLSYDKVMVLEITCSSPLLVTFGSLAMRSLEQLTARCPSRLTLPLDKLMCLSKLREVVLIGSQDIVLKEQLKEQLKDHQNKPTLKFE
ncbi:hypothetical protein U9M48_004219 [Paspalum notatum var. saurae]|uniref:Disease resistance protein RPM1 n=1 Tax=Paspalum notatum var. saurae TaxID=547442 RepID=A0AAQ3PSU1_PASNO